MQRILVVLPFYGGSLPVGRYCIDALRSLGHLVDVFEAPDFFSAFSALKGLQVSTERQEFLEGGFLQLISQAILAKVESFEPDLLLSLAQAPLNRNALKKLRKDGIATAMWFVEDYRIFPYWRSFAPLYDIFAIIQREPFMAELRASGVENFLYLPLAADPSVHKPRELSAAERRIFGSDLSFMGAGYPNRRTAFRHFTRRDLKIWGTEWDGDAELAPLVQRRGERISPEDAVNIFNASRINLNLHSSVSANPPVQAGDFVNPRTFELAACGAFQLVDRRGLMPELFAEDELASFASLEELQEKIDYFLPRPDERAAYAARGRARVLSEHTYEKRMSVLLEFAERRLPHFARKVSQRAADSVKAPWQDKLSEDLRERILDLLRESGLSGTAPFEDLVTAVKQKSGVLGSLESAVLFLDAWRRQYPGKR